MKLNEKADKAGYLSPNDDRLAAAHTLLDCPEDGLQQGCLSRNRDCDRPVHSLNSIGTLLVKLDWL